MSEHWFTAPPQQLTDDLADDLRKIDSPTIANAIETFQLQDRTAGFIGGNVSAMFDDYDDAMLGYALTVKMSNAPGEPAGREGYWRMWEALEQMPTPSVIVVQDVSGSPERYACAGEVMATMAQRLGAVGMVTDGGLRDLKEVRALGFHYYARFPVVSHANFEVTEVGGEIVLDGEAVRTGDLLHGDANGISIIPAGCLDGLVDAVEGIRERESRFMRFIRSRDFNLADAKAGTGY